MRTRRKRRLMFTVGLTLAVIGAAVWWAARPQYNTFTIKMLGPEHPVLRIVYPATWSPESRTGLYITPEVQSVSLHPPGPNVVQRWIDSHVRNIKPSSRLQTTISITLNPYHGDYDLDEESRNFKQATDAIGAGSDVVRTTCNIGTALSRDVKDNSKVLPKDARLVHIFLAAKSPAPRYKIDIVGFSEREWKDSTFRTVDDVISRLRLLDDTTGRASR
jgi:hypothetical protein